MISTGRRGARNPRVRASRRRGLGPDRVAGLVVGAGGRGPGAGRGLRAQPRRSGPRAGATDENYQHGFLVIPIALFILWRRFIEIPWTEPLEVASTTWWGWGLLAVILAVRAFAYEWSFQWVETATLLPAIACLTWAFGGLAAALPGLAGHPLPRLHAPPARPPSTA